MQYLSFRFRVCSDTCLWHFFSQRSNYTRVAPSLTIFHIVSFSLEFLFPYFFFISKFLLFTFYFFLMYSCRFFFFFLTPVFCSILVFTSEMLFFLSFLRLSWVFSSHFQYFLF